MFFSVSLYNQSKWGTLYFASAKLFDFFLHFANFIREFTKVTKYLKVVEIKHLIYPFGQKHLIATLRIQK